MFYTYSAANLPCFEVLKIPWVLPFFCLAITYISYFAPDFAAWILVFTCFCIVLSLAALEIFALSDWLLWLPHFWFHENQSKSALSDTFTLQSVPCNGSQVTYRLMIGSFLLLLGLSQKVFRLEGAFPSNHPEGQEDLPSDISLSVPFNEPVTWRVLESIA